MRTAAEAYRERFRTQGTVKALKSFDIAAAPYPSRFAFQGYNLSIDPMISIINRMFVIQFEGFDGDVELGVGVSLLWTPGHTDGNHSLVVNTPDGVWVSSENGMAADSWQPELSKIPGVKQQARFFNREVVLNSNTLEDSVDQYDSMVKEKTMASHSPRDDRWLQIIPSSECADWKRQWPVVPTFTHGGLDYGTITTR